MSWLKLLIRAAAWSSLVQQPVALGLVAPDIRDGELPTPPGLGAKDFPGLPSSLPLLPSGLPSIFPGLPFSHNFFSSTTSSPPSLVVPSSTELSSTTTTLVFSSIATTSSISINSVSSDSSLISTSSVSPTTLVTASFSKTTSLSTTTSSLPNNATAMSSDDTSGIGSNRTLVITLSTVLSVVGALLVAGGILICWRYRRNRLRLFNRGITPIDDDEIATWKVSREEKRSSGPATGLAGATLTGYGTTSYTRSHAKNPSVGSTKKPPSVIVYPGARRSEDQSMKSVAYNSYGAGYGKKSFDNKELPQTPIQARAPNAREGLTDETVPGADPFLPSPKRHPSRLSKLPPLQSPRSAHTRTRSSRSSASMRSFGDAYGSEMELSPRTSHDYYWSSRRQSRAFSAAPPRLSFGDDFVIGGLSPRPLIRDDEIGRAIG